MFEPTKIKNKSQQILTYKTPMNIVFKFSIFISYLLMMISTPTVNFSKRFWSIPGNVTDVSKWEKNLRLVVTFIAANMGFLR